MAAEQKDEMRDLVERASALGAEHGTAGGSWVFDGNTPHEDYVGALEEDGDDWWELYGPDTGPLSGEWADGMTPDGLFRELGQAIDFADPDQYERDLAPLCDAYEQAYYAAWRDEVLRMARYQVGES